MFIAIPVFTCTYLDCAGAATGCAASPQELAAVQSGLPASLPVLVGSGVTAANLPSFASATALIIGTHFKQGDHWANPLDEQKSAILSSFPSGTSRHF